MPANRFDELLDYCQLSRLTFKPNQKIVMKLSRNDPCSCGSGKKYKHCCLNSSDTASEPPIDVKAHDGAIDKSMTWLSTHQRKGWQVAFSTLFEKLLSEPERQAVGRLGEDAVSGIQINLTEWLLAEGSIQVKGESRRVADYLIGPFGPSLTPGQRNWVQQMAQRPLRLYKVTDVIPGAKITLCDALMDDAEPVQVLERSGSQTIQPGMLLGARIMHVGDHFELSGAAYQFSIMAGHAAAQRLRQFENEFAHTPDLAQEQALLLMSSWLHKYVAPLPIPTIVDHYSGEPMVAITDHYRVLDWDALTQALQSCADVEGDRSYGWTRLIDCEDGQQRPSLNINPGKKPDQIEVFYTTQLYADQGKEWLRTLIGPALILITRKVTDPQSLAHRGKKSIAKTSKSVNLPDIDPKELHRIIETVLQRTYANWCGEPIPDLNNKTPRQAIQTTAGLERVKGLIRSYEKSEAAQALQQGRTAVSYDFLWAAIGLSR